MVSFAAASFTPFPYLTLAATTSRRKHPFLSFSNRNRKSVSVLRRCKVKANWDLEGEILEFMKNSLKPGAFPSRKELVDAGRMDLVDGIRRQGGWLSLGWDSDDDIDCNLSVACELDVASEQNSSYDDRSTSGFDEAMASSSMTGSSLDMEVEKDSGIHGILHRLEKERSMTFGIGPREAEGAMNDSQPGSSADTTVAGHGRSSWRTSLSLSYLGTETSQRRYLPQINSLEDPVKPVNWSNWNAQKENSPTTELKGNSSMDDMFRRAGFSENLHRTNNSEACVEEIDHSSNYIQTCLKNLNLELSSALQSLRSKSVDITTRRVHETSSEKLRKLSDAWEFQETEIVHAKEQLRSIRVKLSVIEGKMALAIKDAQKLLEDKQKRINDTHSALLNLRNACIVWPNSASEVFLAGSFDGWSTQKKMEKSSTGIFSLSLKLYLGRYEIKFIVDGEWKIDPLRPVVNNNGFENNLLIVA